MALKHMPIPAHGLGFMAVHTIHGQAIWTGSKLVV
ncbi:hypothetical protein BMETH_211_1 [methanotrophic bacterial endosymbiont of Bathymodiolus sp.]|nr:hypothetical protein BMETH_211_1 [methanotrophic bacterial endosymbiont of Bathymodiolus sp.]